MAHLEGTPVNEPNPTTQAKLEGTGTPPVAPVVPAPAAAPVAPVVPAVAPVTAPAAAPVQPAATDPLTPVEPTGIALPDVAVPTPKWVATGNASLDSIGVLLDEKGIDGAVALEEFNKYGEVSQETYDAFVAKAGAPTANLILGQFDQASSALRASAQDDAKAIYETVGGEADWKQVAEWSKSEAVSPTERAEYNKMLKAGGKSAQLAAKELKERMMADPQYKSRADLVGSSAVPVGAGQPAAAVLMDRATYSAKIRVAEQRGDVREIGQLREDAKHSMKTNPYWKVGNPKT